MANFYHFELQPVLLITFIFSTSMASTDTDDFFPDVKGNLSKITWAHAVNNFSYLTDTLRDDKIMMIEADVVIGKVDGTGYDIPIMGHPPANKSDLSLEAFLLEVKKHNKNETSQKGIKLDFKSTEVVIASVDIVTRYDTGNFPIWINADILAGPINSSVTPVDPVQFLEKAKSFPNSTLSIGWTTNYGPNMTGSYEKNQIQEMIDTIQKNNVSQQITFPVRAGLAASSIGDIQNLLSKVEKSTLTVWSSEGDNVDVENLRSLIASIGLSRVYVDVPVDLLDKLHLDNNPGGVGRHFVSMYSVLLSVCVGILSRLVKGI